MRFILPIALAGGLTTASLSAAEPPVVSLMPAAAEVRWGQWAPVDNAVAIVLSDQASPAEREAAKLLVQYVERRFGQRWNSATPGNLPPDVQFRLYLGQPKSFPALDLLCRQQGISVPEHEEGYALKVWGEGDTLTAVVAGASGRGVIYAQDTLFQLLKRQGPSLAVQCATIRDWPAIPLRGRPHPHYQYYLKPENFDCMMTSRINFIDLRDGIYAFEPGAEPNREEIGRIITDARARELRVYAAVNCGVSRQQQDSVIDLFEEFLDLGADGLWASFDDKGSGEAPLEMMGRVIELGRAHGITGDRIAITPPKGDYQTVNTEFNRKVAGVSGMEQAVWYWTSIPDAENLASAQAIGLQVNPSWWYNWPRVMHPSFRAGSDHPYLPACNLADGWNHPTDRELREMDRYVHAVMPWDGWQSQQYYLVPAIGWWSWRPEGYDSQSLRRRIYDMAFGPDQVETACAFDDELGRIRGRFRFWLTQTDYAPACPPRLKSLDDRPRTQEDLAALYARLEPFRQGATIASVLERRVLEQEYLGALTRELETALAATQAPYPEYWWPSHQDAVLRRIYESDKAGANRLIDAVRDRVLTEVSQVERMLPHLGTAGRYADWWRQRARATADDWRNLLEKRQTELRDRIAVYNKTVAPTSRMLSGLDDPPIQVGTGVWTRHNHLLATVVPEPRETWWGDWIGGIHEYEGASVAVFALAKHQRVNAGVHSELPVNIPLAGRRDHLALLVYLADANKESFGLGRAKWRWSGYRAIKLLWGERELWSADLGIPRLTGEWFVVSLPQLPADLQTLPLRLRVEDYYSAKNNLEIVYVGPIRLLELDRP